MELFKYEDIIGKLYVIEFKDFLGEPRSFTGYVENFCPSGVVALHGYTGIVVVRMSDITLLRPTTKRETDKYEKFFKGEV